MTEPKTEPKKDSMPFENKSTGVCETCRACKIEIGAASIAWRGRHSFLVYTYYEGDEEKQIFYRYGPDGDDPYPADSSRTNKSGELIWNHNTNYTIIRNHDAPLSFWNSNHTVWGRLRGVYGEWEGSYEQAEWEGLGAPLVELANGPQWCNKHPQLVMIMRDIVSRGLYYDPTTLNCNSGTNTMLRRFSLPFTLPDSGWYPARDVDILHTEEAVEEDKKK